MFAKHHHGRHGVWAECWIWSYIPRIWLEWDHQLPTAVLAAYKPFQPFYHLYMGSSTALEVVSTGVQPYPAAWHIQLLLRSRNRSSPALLTTRWAFQVEIGSVLNVACLRCTLDWLFYLWLLLLLTNLFLFHQHILPISVLPTWDLASWLGFAELILWWCGLHCCDEVFRARRCWGWQRIKD